MPWHNVFIRIPYIILLILFYGKIVLTAATSMEHVRTQPRSLSLVPLEYNTEPVETTDCRLQIECNSPVRQSGAPPDKTTASRIRVPIRSARGPPGPIGPQGIPGPMGPRGPSGPPGECVESRTCIQSTEILTTIEKSRLPSAARKRAIYRQKNYQHSMNTTESIDRITLETTSLGREKKYRRVVRFADKNNGISLKDIFLPPNMRFTDRLVSLEEQMGECVLHSGTPSANSANSDVGCTKDVYEVISPTDGILIDWDRMEGITVQEFWSLIENALLNETFDQVEAMRSTASAKIASVSWNRLTAENDDSFRRKFTERQRNGKYLRKEDAVRNHGTNRARRKPESFFVLTFLAITLTVLPKCEP